MSEFNLRKKISSCEVSKELIGQIEDYLKLKVLQLVVFAGDNNKYCVEITDGFGDEILESIKNYTPTFFADKTSKIKLSLNCYSPNIMQLLNIEVRFSRDRLYIRNIH